ncbi:MAG: ABC-F family ATP-binding cassette domain-containing protein [Thermoplasmatota archaeon]
MQPLLKADDLWLAFGPVRVLEGARFLIHPGDKIALVGPNGAGKTTIFRLLSGLVKPDLGTLTWDREARVEYLPQVPDIPPQTPVSDILAEPSAAARDLKAEIGRLELWMATSGAWEEPDSEAKLARYGELQSRLAQEMANARATDSPILNDLGLPEETLSATFGSLSGGERSKVLLAKVLTAAPKADLLLLDEPTNHMDIPTVEFIEEYLVDVRGSVVLAAHDRYLLDHVADRVFEVDHRKVASYEGNYSSYQAQRVAWQRAVDAKRRRQTQEMERQLRIIEELKVRNKFDAQIRSRKTRMQDMAGAIEEAPTQRKSFRLLFETERPPREVLRVEGVAKAFGGRTLFSGVDLEIEGGDKIGIVGPNGCGKSTLVKILAGRLAPDAGTVKVGPSVAIGYFDQHHETLEPDRSLIEEARSLRNPPPPDEWSRGLLGRFHFSGDAVFQRVGELSGGERARLALAKFIVGKYNTLILDEPTNHLDLESQEVVASALAEYEGTLVVVSHNRSFLDRVCTKTAFVAHRRVALFPGRYSAAAATKPVADFVAAGIQGRLKVLKSFRDWESGARYHQGQTIQVTGMETQAFRRLLRWAEGEGRVEAM